MWRALPRSEDDAGAASLSPLETLRVRACKGAVNFEGVLNLGSYPALVEHEERGGISSEARAEEAAHHIAASLSSSN